MRAVTYVSNNTVEITQKPVPDISATEVLLRVDAAGLCHSDLEVITLPEGNPYVGGTLGHEIVGTVHKMGDAVSGWQLGDRAIAAVMMACGSCRECMAGRDNQCEIAAHRDIITPLTLGIGGPGGMSDFVAVEARNLESIGDLDPVEAAPLADAAVTPMHAINSVRDRLRADATVLIIGLGGLGHLALQILAATSAVRVIATDTDPAKLEYAARNGADLVLESGPETAQRVLEATGGHGADVVFDFVGVQQTVEVATRSVRVGGALRFVGIGGGSFTYRAGATRFPWGVNVESAYGGTRQDLREVIALAKRGKIRPEIVRYSLDDAVQAFDDLKAGRVQGRAVFVP